MKKLVTFLPCILGIAALLLWQLFSSSVNHYLVSVIVLLLSMLPFFTLFESSKPSAEELALTAGLIAIAVISRAAFYLIPQVKPIGAVVVVAGACLGGRRGYFIGAMSAFISNFIFTQGIWTPFQMVALGMVGLLSGLLFKHLKPSAPLLAGVGFVLCFGIYGLIVDSCTVLVMSQELTLQGVLSVYLSGIVFNLVFGLTTAVFLAAFGKQFVAKLKRIIVKYNIIEV